MLREPNDNVCMQRHLRPAWALLTTAVVAAALASCATSTPSPEAAAAGTTVTTATGTTTATTATTGTGATAPEPSAGTAMPPSTPRPPTTGPAFPTGTRVERTYVVDGLDRRTIVRAPAGATTATALPLVFVFHGHGGSGANAERSFPVHDLWPGAVVVYPFGLTGATSERDPEGERPGWQSIPGELADRDLHFYDAMLDDLVENLPIDTEGVYVLGHSNGARMASVVWHERPDEIAAVATSSAQPGRMLLTAEPRPLFMSMGTEDQIADYAQQRLSIEPARELLQIDPATTVTDGDLVRATGPDGLELVTHVHAGGHDMPPGVLEQIVAFFQRH